MMKKIFPIALLSLFALTSCEDAIDLKPQSQVSVDDYFKDATQLQLFSNSFYNNLLTKEPYTQQSDIYVCQTLSETVLNGTKRTVPVSGGGWTWTDLRKANTLLENMYRCDDEAAVKKFSAVARFFRAYFYFAKIQRFGDVPWYETELGSADPALYNPRDSRELVMTKMIEDIDYAIENLPTKANESSAPYRVTKGGALAFKSQFCLFEGTFRKYHNINLEGHDYKYYLEQSAKAAKQLMDGEGGSYKLYSTGNVNCDYQDLFVKEDADPNEYILAIKFDNSLAIFHKANSHTLGATGGMPGFTRKMVNMYLMKDGSRFTEQAGWQTMEFKDEMKNRDPRLSQSIRGLGYHRYEETEILAPDLSTTTTGYQPIKFVQANGKENHDRNDHNSNDIPVLRLAEVYLNYAEAKAELGTLTQEDLNVSVNLLRKRAGMPNMSMEDANSNPDRYLTSEETGFTNVTGSNAGVILEIRRERTIELVMEGYRYSDLLRWKAGKCIDQDITGMYFPGPGSYDLTGDGVADLILYTVDQGKPTTNNGEKAYMIGQDLRLTNGTSGYLDYHVTQPRNGFNEVRDYFYPIPIGERTLNPNLTQNPGWADGLDF